MSIDRNSPMPLYYQLKQILTTQIESGELKPGDILPTEHQIQEIYDVSRTTVRQALAELEAEGKVSRYRGRGTFVNKPKISHNPEEYPNLAARLSQQGINAGWKLLSHGWVAPPADIRDELGLSSEQKAYCLRRLRLEDEDPIGYHIAYVSPYFATAIEQSSFTEGGSLRYLRAPNILEKSTANRIIEAVPASLEESALLNIAKGAPLLRIKRLVMNQDNQPVESFRGLYRGDRFQYHITNMRAISTINA